MSSSLCDSNPCRPQRCILCNNNCTNGYTCVENETDTGLEFNSGTIGDICAARIMIIIILLVVVLVGLFLLWRRKSYIRTLMIQGQQRETAAADAETKVTFLEPTENNVRLLNTSVVSSVTAYKNLDFNDDEDYYYYYNH